MCCDGAGGLDGGMCRCSTLASSGVHAAYWPKPNNHIPRGKVASQRRAKGLGYEVKKIEATAGATTEQT